jgi:sulfur-oxidizing protein SoxY
MLFSKPLESQSDLYHFKTRVSSWFEVSGQLNGAFENYQVTKGWGLNVKRQTLAKLAHWPILAVCRSLLFKPRGGAFALGVGLLESRSASAQALEVESEEFRLLFQELTQGQAVIEQRVHLSIPRLADNGHSVPLRVWVDSAQSESDHVKRLIVLSCRNPRPLIARFQVKPMQIPLSLSTRIRLNGSQRIWALAQLNDDSWWGAHAQVEVTESACLDATL